MRAGFGFAFVALIVTTGCTQTDFGDPVATGAGNEDGRDPDDPAPGTEARDPEQDVSCESDDDCFNGEVCGDGLCQMERCADGPYISSPPLAGRLRFSMDRELLVADSVASDGEYYVDGYAPAPGSVDYPGSWSMGSQPITDIVGGDFLATEMETFAVGLTGSNEIVLGGIDGSYRMGIGFAPTSIAAGDLDRDGKDEIVALGQFGNVAYCHMDIHDCSTFAFDNANGLDVAIADVEGDGYDEAIFLLDNGGTTTLYVWNAEVSEEGLDEDHQGPTGHDLLRIDAGDLDGDGLPEVVGIEDGTLLDGAHLYTYSVSDGGVAELSARDVDDASIDVAVSDIDHDERADVVVLREGGTVELLQGTDEAALLPIMTHQLQVSAAPHRISAGDFDGDSPRMRLIDGEGKLLSGPVTPITVAHFPPYDAEHSPTESSVIVGNADISGERWTDTVSLGAKLDLGVKASVFGLFEAGLGTRISTEIKKKHSESIQYKVGTRIKAEASPQYAGYEYALVVMSCSCFHAYYYELEDPAGLLQDGADGEELVMILPVGGTTVTWSSTRYNAMAEAVGGLPIIEVPYVLGDPGSYPTRPQRANGDPIETADMVFENLPNLLVGDIASVSARLSVKETESNEISRSTSLEVSADLGVGPFKFGTGLGVGWGESHRVTVGEEAMFGGSVPPIPDNPDTPEDEYLERAFSFVPYVYREHYTDRDGNDAAYYVMSWAVGGVED